MTITGSSRRLNCYVFCWWSLCLTLTVSSRLEDDVAVAHVYADKGTSVSLPCMPQSLSSSNQNYALPSSDENSQLVWVREGKALQHSRVDKNGILTLNKVTLGDAGLYTCHAEESFADDSDKTFIRNIAQVELHVKTTPPAPTNLTVYPSSVLALVTWKLNGTGGYPIRSITVIYQHVTDDLDNPSWHRTFPEELDPTITQIEIYKLEPNTTYRFRVWSSNKLGPGDYSEITATTKDTSHKEVHGRLVTTLSNESRFESNPWVLSMAVLTGSAGFTVLVLSFFLFQSQRMRSRRRTYASSEDMELVTNIILNPSYMDNDRASLLLHSDSMRHQSATSVPLKCNTDPVSL